MIQKFEHIPTTETSHPYATAAVKCRFESRGYVEDEYFMHGTANVYATKEGKMVVAHGDAPYVNRLLIRRPKDTNRFSGNVVVEILNASNFMDIDRVWVLTREKLMRDGDIYVGITSKPCTVPVMRKLDPERYATLSWKNPRRATLPESQIGNLPGASKHETEDGLLWDMLLELPAALRDQRISPLKDYLPLSIYLSGWSQSGGYMITFMNRFAYKNPAWIKRPIYDGYFSTGSGAVAAPGVNQEESCYAASADAEVPWKLSKLYQPFMEIHTESENNSLGNDAARYEDSDAEDFLYRAYDIPGSSHDVKDNMVDYYALDPDLSKTGIFPNYGGKEPYVNDYPYNFIFHRALNLLFDWVRKGEKPPHVARIKLEYKGGNAQDGDGNALGGWRTAFLDLPTATYVPMSTPLKPEFTMNASIFGHKVPFAADELRSRYGSLGHYGELVAEYAGRQVAEGLLEPADEDAYVATALGFARDGGLE